MDVLNLILIVVLSTASTILEKKVVNVDFILVLVGLIFYRLVGIHFCISLEMGIRLDLLSASLCTYLTRERELLRIDRHCLIIFMFCFFRIQLLLELYFYFGLEVVVESV